MQQQLHKTAASNERSNVNRIVVTTKQQHQQLSSRPRDIDTNINNTTNSNNIIRNNTLLHQQQLKLATKYQQNIQGQRNSKTFPL